MDYDAMKTQYKIYEEHYGKGKSTWKPSFLRRHFLRYYTHRNDLAEQYLNKGGVFLDAGCCGGEQCFRLKPFYQKVIGIDISPTCLKRAESRVVSKFPQSMNEFLFLLCDLNAPLPFRSESISSINCVSVIEHIFDIYSLVREFYRILEPTGRCVIQTANIAYIKHRISLLLGRLPHTHPRHNWHEIGWDGGNLHYFTMKTFCQLIEYPGFKIIRRTGTGFLAPLRNWYPSLLTGDCAVIAEKPAR